MEHLEQERERGRRRERERNSYISKHPEKIGRRMEKEKIAVSGVSFIGTRKIFFD